LRCPSCRKEIVLAKTCPYCGYYIQYQENNYEKNRRPQGKLTREIKRPGFGITYLFKRAYSFFIDKIVPIQSKIAVMLAIIYVLYPNDFIPSSDHSLIGWVDDVLVTGLAWRYIKKEL
jgi:uncharacterized membrane protein YkvA (DUF1232 family)